MEATECLFWNCRKQMELEAMKKQRREREAFQDVMGEKEQDGKVMTNQKFGKDAFISKDELLGHVTGFIRNKRKRINLSNREEFLVFSDQDNTCARTGASYITAAFR
ncbi:hypothetical protein BC829DRAFT_161633 [Chytridium lagenaria]|nr:hypothetical protein BC829DRAFT_161633 [Chytridium lagenaria]